MINIMIYDLLIEARILKYNIKMKIGHQNNIFVLMSETKWHPIKPKVS